MKKYRTWLIWGGIAAVGIYLYMKNKNKALTNADLTNKANSGTDTSGAPKPPQRRKMIVSTEMNFTGTDFPRSRKRQPKTWNEMNQGDSTSISKACMCSDRTYTQPNDIPNIIY
jgi:hypothetical protein